MAESGTGFNWRGKEYKRQMERHLGRNLDSAAIMLSAKIKESFGSSGVTGTRSGATKAQRAANRSEPWGPPNVDTGHLKRNVGYDTPVGRPFTRRVGTGIGNMMSVGYAMWLEFGTRKMLPRPFLRTAMSRFGAQIRKMISRPMAG